MLLTCRWTKRCCRTPPAENSEACAEVQAGRQDAWRVGCFDRRACGVLRPGPQSIGIAEEQTSHSVASGFCGSRRYASRILAGYGASLSESFDPGEGLGTPTYRCQFRKP